MILYLFKLILILVFNTIVNTYYINSGCKCCCCESKQTDTGSGGGKSNPIVIEFNKDNIKININSKNLELSSKNMPEGIVHALFTNRTTFCELDEDKYNSFTTDREITFKNPPAENTFVLFAVKTTSGKYYLGYCNNGNSVGDNGLFCYSIVNEEIKILGNGCGLNNINNMFSLNIYLKNIVFTNCFDTSNVTDMHHMFYNCSAVKELNLSSFNTSNLTDMSYMFCCCTSLTNLNLSNFSTSKVENMTYMFFKCSALTKLNLSNFNTNNVTNMSYMFYVCSLLVSLDLSNFNTSKATNMKNMFSGCSSLKVEKLICKDEKIKDALNAPVK